MGCINRGHPVGQGGIAHGLASVDIALDESGDLFPAGRLPDLQWAMLPTVAPAHRQIDFARGIGDLGQVERTVVEQVAVDGPEELEFGPVGFGQRLELLGGVADGQYRFDFFIQRVVGVAVVAAGRVEHANRLALLAEYTSAAFLAQRAGLDQLAHPGGFLVMRVPRIVFEFGLHRANDICHRVQSDNVGQTKRGRLRSADGRPGQRIDGIETQPQPLRVIHGGNHREHADPVGDEVGGVAGTDYALAQGLGHEDLELVENIRVSACVRDQFDQMHVARRVEEMHATETGPILLRQYAGQFADREAGGVRGKNRVRMDVLFDPVIQRLLDVDTLGDGLDDEIAVGQFGGVILEVGRLEELGKAGRGQWCRLELAEACDRTLDQVVAAAFLCRQVE